MMRADFKNLARSIYAGSVEIDQLTFVVRPGQIPDIEYHKFRLRNAEPAATDEPLWQGVYNELVERFDYAFVPGVVEWRQ